MIISKMWAPKCALPNCNNKVGYHKKYVKQDGTPGWKWKNFCEHHRKAGIADKQAFYSSRGGCENRDGRLGYKCKDHLTKSLTIDHWDGDRRNTNEENLVVLCANCHQEKTKIFGDHKNRYITQPAKFNDLIEFV